jgi:hypothetical protein
MDGIPVGRTEGERACGARESGCQDDGEGKDFQEIMFLCCVARCTMLARLAGVWSPFMLRSQTFHEHRFPFVMGRRPHALLVIEPQRPLP